VTTPWLMTGRRRPLSVATRRSSFRGADAGRLKYLEEKSLPRFGDKFFSRSSRFRELAPDFILVRRMFLNFYHYGEQFYCKSIKKKLYSIAVTDICTYEMLSRKQKTLHIFFKYINYELDKHKFSVLFKTILIFNF